jgi:23S rRNA (adenine-N6)-dimethyltransferase
VADAAVFPGELVLDIGAGDGALTEVLVSVGARVVAVELNSARLEQLRRRFEGRGVTVVKADASDLRLPRRPFRVVANPPFAVVQALLRRLLNPGSRMTAADLVVPRHTARLWSGAGAPAASRWRRQFAVAVAGRVPATAFSPPATKDAAVLVIRRLQGAPFLAARGAASRRR